MTTTELGAALPLDGERIVFDDLEIGEIALDLDDQEPEDVIAWALESLGDRVAIVTAMQADGMVVLDMAARIRPDVRVITVDTGRLPQETYSFVDEVRARYPQTRWQVLFPDTSEVEAMVRQQGTELFRRSVPERMLCCRSARCARWCGRCRAWTAGSPGCGATSGHPGRRSRRSSSTMTTRGS